MDANTTLTDRQIREKNYYETYALSFDPNQAVDLAPIEGPLLNTERRPWNSYWRTYELSVDYYQNTYRTPITLLDFGCGPGDNAIRFSKIGYQVTGFDICEMNVKNCHQLFSLHPPEEKADFVCCSAEEIELPSNTFDVVVGIDILHHVDIEKSLLEVKRVLKDNGIAVFREPIEAPLIDKIRQTKLMRSLFPNTPSLEHHITPDERKLNSADLKLIKDIFPDVIIERSLTLARFDKFFRRSGDKSPSVLEKIDYKLGKLFPLWNYFGGAAVIIIKKKLLMSLIPLLPTLILHQCF